MVPLPTPVDDSISYDSTHVASTRPLQIYSRHTRQAPPHSLPADSSSTLVGLAPSDLDIPIALRQSKQSVIAHPISNVVYYDRLYPTFRQFTLSYFLCVYT